MAKYAQLSDGRLIEFDDAASDEFMDESVRDFLANEGTLQVEAQPEPEPDPFADQRTATGQAFETIKGVGRGFGGSFSQPQKVLQS